MIGNCHLEGVKRKKLLKCYYNMADVVVVIIVTFFFFFFGTNTFFLNAPTLLDPFFITLAS